MPKDHAPNSRHSSTREHQNSRPPSEKSRPPRSDGCMWLSGVFLDDRGSRRSKHLLRAQRKTSVRYNIAFTPPCHSMPPRHSLRSHSLLQVCLVSSNHRLPSLSYPNPKTLSLKTNGNKYLLRRSKVWKLHSFVYC